MFSGFKRFLKFILPKGLFYRSLIIVAAPTIILQLIVTIVFFDSIWIKANKGMTRSLVGEIKTLKNIYDGNNVDQISSMTESYKNNFNFIINILEKPLPENKFERKFSPIDRSLRRELKSAFGNGNYWFNTTNYLNTFEVQIKLEKKILQIFFPKERVATSSIRLFILWITLPSILLIFIAIIFLKNQTRPIVKLAKAAEKFGKGEYVNDFSASGASEIRKASYEFGRMAKRINRHLNQRSEMLSGISHDLRTPLTRMKLQLEMIQQKDLSKKMTKDIDEMESMLNSYLAFAKSQSTEETTKVIIGKLFREIQNKIDSSNLIIEEWPEFSLNGRRQSLMRCFENIIINGLTYGEKVYISFRQTSNRFIIIFEDNGPGIPEEHYKNVFKPFYRLDKSRSLNQSGVGLGLAIVEDIINSHGGNIQLSKSKFKGLLVKVSLPF